MPNTCADQSAESTPTLSTNPEPERKSSNFRWVIMALAFLITLVNYIDRTAISYAITPLKHDFNINDEQFGYISAAFGVGYMLMTLGGGVLVDKFGPRRVWSLAALLWSGCTALMGFASGLSTLLVFRTMLGIAEGPHFPALTRVVADWLPVKERARATALGLAAVPLSSVVGAPLITHLIATYGWRHMFMALASFGVLWAVVWMIAFRDYPESSKQVSNAELEHIREGVETQRDRSDAQIRSQGLHAKKTTWRFMLTEPSLLVNNYSFFAFGYLLFFAVTWLPGYLEQTYKLPLKDVGIFLIAPWLAAGILLPCAGLLSDWLYNKTGSKRIARSHMIWMCQLASGLCFIPMLFHPTLETAITMISLGVGLGMMPNSAFYAINCDLARDRAATSQGLMNCSSALASIAAPALTGFLAQRTGGFTAAFGLLIFFTLTSVVSVICFHKPDHVKDCSQPV